MAIDKIDKIGMENVKAELAERGLSTEAIAALEPILSIDGTVNQRLERLAEVLSASPVGLRGVEELKEVVRHTEALGLRAVLDLDVSLARGLNYYTGTIIEVKARDVEIGSITGGGRYDNLTGVFGMPDVSGVGISFGADRIYDVLNTLDLYPEDTSRSTKVLFMNFGEAEKAESLKVIKQLRGHGISAEIYPETSKMKKQMAYANSKSVPFVAMIGESELQEGKVTLKDMTTGEQASLDITALIDRLK